MEFAPVCTGVEPSPNESDEDPRSACIVSLRGTFLQAILAGMSLPGDTAGSRLVKELETLLMHRPGYTARLCRNPPGVVQKLYE